MALYKYNDRDTFILPELPGSGQYIAIDHSTATEWTATVYRSTVPFEHTTFMYGAVDAIILPKAAVSTHECYRYYPELGAWQKLSVSLDDSNPDADYALVGVNAPPSWTSHDICGYNTSEVKYPASDPPVLVTSVTGISIDAPDPVNTNSTYNVTVEATGDGDLFDKSVVANIHGATSTGTTLTPTDTDGLFTLTVAMDEKAETLTIYATSVDNPDVTASRTITVSNEATCSITCADSVAAGSSIPVTITATGNFIPAAVSTGMVGVLSLSGNVSPDTLLASTENLNTDRLYVSKDEPAGTLTITGYSNTDPIAEATKTITVTPYSSEGEGEGGSGGGITDPDDPDDPDTPDPDEPDEPDPEEPQEAETPTILSCGNDATYYVGDSAETLVCEAKVSDGGVLTYRWYKDDYPVSKKKSCSVDTHTVGTFYYHCVVTNTLGDSTAEAESDTITIEVIEKNPEDLENAGLDMESLLHGWLWGRRIASRRKIKQPVVYLYNGVRFSQIPQDSRTPYSFIMQKSYGYELYITSTPCTIAEDGYYQWYPGYYGRYLYNGTEWEEKNAVTVNAMVGKLPFVNAVWANYDVLDADKNVYLAASEPVPVYE